eukprot:gb/GECG01001270.1/.p1 GENE.gb/GECG01001270.1/~~gb/GECG01001270.1/.p1  ORF type:complete len:845 (+),score=125.77 gb/GECG01001270.1/:1-2535(+)
MSVSSEGSSSTLERSLARLDASLENLRQGREAFEKQQGQVLPPGSQSETVGTTATSNRDTYKFTSSRGREYGGGERYEDIRADELLSRVEDSVSSIHGGGSQDEKINSDLFPTREEGISAGQQDSPMDVGQLGALPLNDPITDVASNTLSWPKDTRRGISQPETAVTSTPFSDQSPADSPGSYNAWEVPPDLQSLLDSGGTSSNGARSAGADTLRRYGVNIESPLEGDIEEETLYWSASYNLPRVSQSGKGSGLMTYTSVSHSGQEVAAASRPRSTTGDSWKRRLGSTSRPGTRSAAEYRAPQESVVAQERSQRSRGFDHVTVATQTPPQPSTENRTERRVPKSIDKQFSNRKGKSLYAPDVSSDEDHDRSSGSVSSNGSRTGGKRQGEHPTTHRATQPMPPVSRSKRSSEDEYYRKALSDSYEKERKVVQQQTDQTLSHWEELTDAYNQALQGAGEYSTFRGGYRHPMRGASESESNREFLGRSRGDDVDRHSHAPRETNHDVSSASGRQVALEPVRVNPGFSSSEAVHGYQHSRKQRAAGTEEPEVALNVENWENRSSDDESCTDEGRDDDYLAPKRNDEGFGDLNTKRVHYAGDVEHIPHPRITSSPLRRQPDGIKTTKPKRRSQSTHSEVDYDIANREREDHLHRDIKSLVSSIYELIEEFRDSKLRCVQNEKSVQAHDERGVCANDSTSPKTQDLQRNIQTLSSELDQQLGSAPPVTRESDATSQGNNLQYANGKLWVKLPSSVSAKLKELTERQSDRRSVPVYHQGDSNVYVHGILRPRQPTTAEVKPSNRSTVRGKNPVRRNRVGLKKKQQNDMFLELSLPDRSSTYVPVQWKPSKK